MADLGTERDLVDGLARAFRRNSWRTEKPPSGADLLVSKGGKRYVVEVKFLGRKPERETLRGTFASAILQASSYAKSLGGRPLAVVAATRITDSLANDLRQYAAAHAQDVAWGIVDLRGRAEFHEPELQNLEVSIPRSTPPQNDSDASIRHTNPFSDLGQWIVKVLFASTLPRGYVNSPATSFERVSDVARAADVSIATASKVLSSLGRRALVERSKSSIRIVHPSRLLTEWRAAYPVHAHERPAVLLSGVASVEEALLEHHDYGSGGRRRACLGLFSACKALGLGIVMGAPVHVLAEDVSDAGLEQLGFVPVDHFARADLLVRRPAFPESTFRGSVTVDGIPVADALQCWLDVAGHPARGREQAEAILQRLRLES